MIMYFSSILEFVQIRFTLLKENVNTRPVHKIWNVQVNTPLSTLRLYLPQSEGLFRPSQWRFISEGREVSETEEANVSVSDCLIQGEYIHLAPGSNANPRFYLKLIEINSL